MHLVNLIAFKKANLILMPLATTITDSLEDSKGLMQEGDLALVRQDSFKIKITVAKRLTVLAT